MTGEKSAVRTTRKKEPVDAWEAIEKPMAVVSGSIASRSPGIDVGGVT